MHKKQRDRLAARLKSAALASMCLLAVSALGFSEDTVSALLKHQTEVLADASTRGDQALMGSLLDDDVLFSGGSGAVDRDPQRDRADAVSDLLRQQTQAFRNAGQRHDLAGMMRYLDEEVLFVNEDGAVSELQNFRDGAPAAPPDVVSSSVTVSDWVLHYSGDVAVSSFVDDQIVRYEGQELNYKFLSVETWVKRSSAWKLIGSQTIPLYQDPPSVTLPPNGLNDYVGTYAGPGVTAVVSPEGNGLAVSANGGKPTLFQAELRDVFMTPGLPKGYAPSHVIFQRDASGQVAGYLGRLRGAGNVLLTKSKSTASQSPTDRQTASISSTLTLRDFVVHQAGDVAVTTFLHDKVTHYYGQDIRTTYRSSETWIRHGTDWKIMASQGRELAPDPPALIHPLEELNDYVGIYSLGSSLTVKIARAGTGLAASINGGDAIPFNAEARDVFAIAGSSRISILFQRNVEGRVTGYLSRRDGRDLVFKKH